MQRTCHHRSSALNMANVAERRYREIFQINTHTTNSLLSLSRITPTSTSFTCTTCHMHALSSHTPQPTTDNVLHRTPEGTPIGLVHTHLVTCGWIQVVLFNYKFHHISMAVLSCTVDHVVSIIIRAVEQQLHFGGQVADGVDMATRCS